MRESGLSEPQCYFCEQGLLRAMRCRGCGAVVAVCDECELIWRDVQRVWDDPVTPSDGAHPVCPACEQRQDSWELLTPTEVTAAGLVLPNKNR